MGEVELVLTFPAFGVETEEPEVEFGHVAGDPIEEGHRVEGDLEVVGRRRLHRATAGDRVESATADGFGPECVELRLDAELTDVAHLGRLGDLAFERGSRAQRERFTTALVHVGDHPGEPPVPRQDLQGRRVGHADDLVFDRVHPADAAHAARGVAFRAREQVRKVVDGNDFGLRTAENIDPAADRVLHASTGELLGQLLVLLRQRGDGIHCYSTPSGLTLELVIRRRAALRRRERFVCGPGQPGADLPATGTGDADVHHRRDAGVGDLVHIDTGGRAAEAGERDAEQPALGVGDAIHLVVRRDHPADAALVVLQA